jgi:hypothetical protein
VLRSMKTYGGGGGTAPLLLTSPLDVSGHLSYRAVFTLPQEKASGRTGQEDELAAKVFMYAAERTNVAQPGTEPR